MPAFKFTVSRLALVEETYTVEADSEEEALEIANGGGIDYDNGLVNTEFVDWHDDAFQVIDKEDLCPLVKMIRVYNPETVTS